MPLPRLSFGLPVWNGARSIRRTLDSLLAQDFADFEVVVSDNACTDETSSIVAGYASRDPRVRHCRTETKLGLLQNFNRAFSLAQGRYFRWIGCHDTVASSYARACVEALEAHPGAVGVTTLWEFVHEDGRLERAEFHGRRVDGASAPERLARFLWFMQADRLLFDPMYTMFRREVMERTRLLRMAYRSDLYLPLEICLQGPLTHVDENLARRGRPPDEPIEVTAERYHPGLKPYRRFRHTREYLDVAGIIAERRLPPTTLAACMGVLAYYWVRHPLVRWNRGVRRKARRALQLLGGP